MATITSICLSTAMIFVATISAAPNNLKLGLKIPDECKGKGFCAIKPEGYDQIQELVSSLLTPMIIAQNIGDRIGTKKEELSLETDWHNCPYRTKTEESFYAYSYSNKSDDADFIIQHDLLRQPVEMVTCAYDLINTTSSQQCFWHLGLTNEDSHMESSCQSTTATRSLLVYNWKTKNLEKKPYDVPCCCSCQINKKL